MDLSFTPEEQKFQQEVRDWVSEAFPEDIKRKVAAGEHLGKEDQIRWQKILAEKGWIAPEWPAEYGGTGWTATQKYIFKNEMALAGTPTIVPFGLNMVGPVIYTFGNEEQKKEHLPKIYHSDVWWCQGYSEPGSGSDLASLKTKAVSDGDDYIINGTKIWTTGAHLADWIFCLVRTDSSGKNQEGITFLLIDMKSPGIEVSPIIAIDGGHSVNQVFFTDVRVPKANRIGEENKGWTYAKFLLVNERNGIAAVGAKKRTLARLWKLAQNTDKNGLPLAQDVNFQRAMAEAEINLRAIEYSELRYLAGDKAKMAPGAEASFLKVRATELQQHISEMFINAAGYYLAPYAGPHDPMGSNQPSVGPEDAQGAMSEFLYGRAATIYGGSNEIQRDVIAKIMFAA